MCVCVQMNLHVSEGAYNCVCVRMHVCVSEDKCVKVRGQLAGVGSVLHVDSRIQPEVGRPGGYIGQSYQSHSSYSKRMFRL